MQFLCLLFGFVKIVCVIFIAAFILQQFYRLNIMILFSLFFNIMFLTEQVITHMERAVQVQMMQIQV